MTASRGGLGGGLRFGAGLPNQQHTPARGVWGVCITPTREKIIDFISYIFLWAGGWKYPPNPPNPPRADSHILPCIIASTEVLTIAVPFKGECI